MLLDMKGIAAVCVLTTILFGCQKKERNDGSIEETSYPVSDFLSECQPKKDSLSVVVDSTNGYKVSFPIGWDVDLTKAEDIDGLYGMDTLAFLEQELIHTFIVHVINPNQNVSLLAYFKSEVNGMEEQQIPILEVGSISVDEQEALWVVNTSNNGESPSKDLFVYTKHPRKNKILTLHLSVSDTDEYKERLCSMSNILASFQFLPSTVSASLL